MRQHVAVVIPAILAGGCSLIYNPSNIDKAQDAPIADAMIDANSANLMITGVESPALLEGQGDEGSRPAVLVVRGMNIVSGASVSVMPASGSAMVEVVNEPAIVSAQSDLIAVKVIARVDRTLAANTTRELVVKVSQPSSLGGIVEKMTTWQLKGLGELEGANNTVNTNMIVDYSHVSVAALAFSGTGRVIVRATAGISITNAINVSAVTNMNDAVPGPGGFGGGGPEADGEGPGLGKQGVGSSKGGGGAGFATAGGDGGNNLNSGGVQTGDRLITRYMQNAGSGGGGADGFGGAGGGTLELTAGGNLTVGALISSNGSAGKGGTLLAAGGGGGSGGCVVLRSGATATVNDISLSGGAGGTGTLAAANGGPGKEGRARIDAVTISGNAGPAHRGVMFDLTAPVITRSAAAPLHLLGSSGDRFDIQPAKADYSPTGMKKTIDFGGATTLDDTTPALERGFNRVCLVPEGSGLGNPESRNCIDVAYLP